MSPVMKVLVDVGRELYQHYLDNNETEIIDQINDLPPNEAAVVMAVIIIEMRDGRQLPQAIDNFLNRML